MKRVAVQLFLIWSDNSSFNTSHIALGVTSWLFIVFLFLEFHIAHVVIEIRMRNLLESLLWSSSNEKVAAPLIWPSDTPGQFLVVAFCHEFSRSPS